MTFDKAIKSCKEAISTHSSCKTVLRTCRDTAEGGKEENRAGICTRKNSVDELVHCAISTKYLDWDIEIKKWVMKLFKKWQEIPDEQNRIIEGRVEMDTNVLSMTTICEKMNIKWWQFEDPKYLRVIGCLNMEFQINAEKEGFYNILPNLNGL